MASAPPTSPPPPAVTYSDLLTLIITTSPTPSAPSTDLISGILQSFRRHCPTLNACRVVLVLDTFDRIGSVARLKRGCVTAEGAECFAQYKGNAKQLILEHFSGNSVGDEEEACEGAVPEVPLVVSYAEAEYGLDDRCAQRVNSVPLTITRSQDGRITFIEPLQRIGFGLAVRSALRLTETPYVWVQQHDWTLVSDVPVGPMLDLMMQQKQFEGVDPSPDADSRQVVTVPIKYVCVPSVRMLNYHTSDHVVNFPALRAITNLHKQNFSPPVSRLSGVDDATPRVKIPLTPLFFWHDKPHLAETEHYVARIFPNRLAMPRGGFIEDISGHRARTEMKDGQWRKWACWLYYPEEGKKLCLRHLKGRTWRGEEGEFVKNLEWMCYNVDEDS